MVDAFALCKKRKVTFGDVLRILIDAVMFAYCGITFIS